ncbi:hypothetical protein A3I35_00220 [Candidatus Falkowbacteria bacterium RIFCSPLOWO2_02_FULL_45_15]|uniref:GIY-YIG domain-containing protein n=2 Tax=Candidatus Falkowiibacteriota TaxID=1752728 RepID=A0A1F5RYJ7_9BACT|nr:MAG: hypothetical protein A3I35_00220 [Candidatus Falkowbacteria bacterium RIFCSPLOWO2_02_FULL_45_15]OGF19141.1 MAG: hypothetical protein A3D54_03030 [Candidatus Falkowbacteria bacterium RIFCSPHIGHO2_02_FULL_45_15]
MFYLYILKSDRDNHLYIGSTKDLTRRLKEHNNGVVFSTKNRRPLKLVYYEAYSVESEARKREHNLKLRANALNQLKIRIRGSLKH